MNPGTCAAANQGVPCSELALPFEPVFLCWTHLNQVASLAPRVLAENLNLIRAGAPGTVRTYLAAYLIASAEPAELPVVKRHASLVYFARNGDRVKIGFSTQITTRLRALSLRRESVMLLLPGGRDLEGALHAKFAALGTGESEWFRQAPEILDFIASKNPAADLPVLA